MAFGMVEGLKSKGLVLPDEMGVDLPDITGEHSIGDKDLVDGDLLSEDCSATRGEVLPENDLRGSDLAESSKEHTYLLNFLNEVFKSTN